MRIVFALLLLFANALAQGPDPNQGYDIENQGPWLYIDKPILLGGYESILKAFIYPEDALAEKIEGIVTITCTIDIDGHAQDVRAILGPQQLMSAAEDAVELSQWNPGRLNRAPLPLSVRFDLDIRISNILELKETTEKEYSNNLILGSLFFGIIYLILS
ncbi:MAG: energy transducer TonB [FCB group bacterium]|nr:energy transducer TonB [FCB group bacterium]